MRKVSVYTIVMLISLLGSFLMAGASSTSALKSSLSNQLSPISPSARGQQLTLLDKPVFAFEVVVVDPYEYILDPKPTDIFREYSFDTLPSSAILALCLCKLKAGTGSGKFGRGFGFADLTIEADPTNLGGGQALTYSVGADNVQFNGTFFAYIPVLNGTTWCSNVGDAARPVEVYVVGYVTEETTSSGFNMDFLSHDYSLVTDGGSSLWTDVSLSVPQHIGTLKGLYVAVHSLEQTEVAFRRKGDVGNGTTWTLCQNNRGPFLVGNRWLNLDEYNESHSIGWIPASDDGFEFKSTNPVSIWVEGFVFECPISSGERFSISNASRVSYSNNTWQTSPAYTSAKAVIVGYCNSPGTMGKLQVRPTGSSNTEIWYQKNSCGGYTILTGLGSDNRFEYYINASTGGYLDIGAIVLTGVSAVSNALLADQINACLTEVWNWSDVVDVGVIMHKSELSDFDAWITHMADAGDWKGVFAVKRYADQAGYNSSIIDSKVVLALNNIPMFSYYALPKTDNVNFWPWDRYVLYGYKYAQEMNCSINRWNLTSGFLGLKFVRDWYGSAFYECNPDIPYATDLHGTRWHQAGSLMDCFFIFYRLGVTEALDYAVQEWNWLNDNLWVGDHYNYAPRYPGWELSGISVFPNVGKLRYNYTNISDFERVVTDLEFRYISDYWDSPQWSQIYKQVVEHCHTGNPQTRLDGTLDAWIMLNEYYPLLNSGNRTNMKNMLEGNGVTQTWKGLVASDLKQNGANLFRGMGTSDYDSPSTARAALCLFLMGISPQNGRGLAVPLISDRHSCYAALNYRHFEFDYANRTIKIPVWGGTTLKFLFGSPVIAYFGTDGIYSITFDSEWSTVSHLLKISDLYSNEYYIWTLARAPAFCDINGDRKVDRTDIVIVVQQFGVRGSNLPEDVTGDGKVDMRDIALVARHFNETVE